MEWTISPDGGFTATTGGIHFNLIPCPDALFDLADVQATAEHLGRMQANGMGWAEGASVGLAYRVEPPKPERKPQGKRSVTR